MCLRPANITQYLLLTSFLMSTPVLAAPLPAPTDAFLYELKASLVKVNTTTKSGGHGFGTAVAISKDLAVTNCHVIGNANGISISKWGTEYPVDSFQADWKHDLCILKVAYADLKPVTLGDSCKLHYEQPLISISMPNDSPAPYVALSAVKALYPMDDGVVIRSQAAFSIGASGSPVFDYDGRLVGISTFKSPGKHAYFYNMPVNWVKAALTTAPITSTANHNLPFWDAPEESRPLFMQIVLPFQNERWNDVLEVANRWLQQEPGNPEAWYYKGEATAHLGNAPMAMTLFQKALTLHPDHPATLQAVALLQNAQGKQAEIEKIRLTLKEINPELLENLDNALSERAAKP